MTRSATPRGLGRLSRRSGVTAFAQDGRGRSESSLVAINSLAPLVPFLRLDREGRNRPRVETSERDCIAGLDAIAIRAVVDARPRGLDLGDQLAPPVAGAKLDRPVGLRRRAVGEVGMILALLLQRGQGVAALGQDRFAPCDQFAAEIFPLSLVHERFVVRRPIAFNGDVLHLRILFPYGISRPYSDPSAKEQ